MKNPKKIIDYCNDSIDASNEVEVYGEIGTKLSNEACFYFDKAESAIKNFNIVKYIWCSYLAEKRLKEAGIYIEKIENSIARAKEGIHKASKFS